MSTPIVREQSSTFLPVQFRPPHAQPVLGDLWTATTWGFEDSIPRWLSGGVQVRTENYGTASSVGIWEVDDPFCGDPGDQVKTGTPPVDGDPWPPTVVWGFAEQCDPFEPVPDVRRRAEHNLMVQRQRLVEEQFAGQAVERAPTLAVLTASGCVRGCAFVDAVAALDAAIADTMVPAYVVAPVTAMAAARATDQIVDRSPVRCTPLGNRWVFCPGGDPDVLVAVSQPFGWSSPLRVETAVDDDSGLTVAVAEQTFVVGVEQVIGKVRL